MRVDGERRHGGPFPWARHAVIEACHCAYARLLQVPNNVGQIVGPDFDIAVGDHQQLVRGQRQHVAEVGYLTIESMLALVDVQRDAQVRTAARESLHSDERVICAMANAADQLHRSRIILTTARFETALEAQLQSAQRFEE